MDFEHVVWTGTRFVATGAGDGDGIFLDSADGITWHRQLTTTTNSPSALASGPRGVVAVFLVDHGWASRFSPDGLTWTTRVGAFPMPTLGTDVVTVKAVVATDDGWLAVGRQDHFCQINCGLAPVRAIAWRSSDGLHWTRVPNQASFSKAAMTGVARLGSGFVAVGFAEGRGVIWTSADGSTWKRVPDDPMFHPRSSKDPTSWIVMTGIATGHGMVVAVGRDALSGCTDICDSSLRAWWSADGRTWEKATGNGFPDAWPSGVTATPGGFLATGGGRKCPGGIWSSTDGRAWRCIASDPAFSSAALAAAASSSIEVAVGRSPTIEDPPSGGFPSAVWWRPIP